MSLYYLAGKMTGIPQSNFPAFDAAAAALRKAGYDIVSPAELDDPEDRALALANQPSQKTWGDFLARDVRIIVNQAHGIIFLSDWWESRGARLEAFTALLAGKKMFGLYLDEGQQPPVAWMSADLVRSILRGNMP